MRELLKKSIEKRTSLLSHKTNALRLVDGEGDGLSDLFLDCFADHWLVSTRTGSLPSDLREYFKTTGKSVYWKQLDQHQKESPSHLAGPAVNEPFTAMENGVRYKIDFQAGYSQGIFLDQRENRQRVIERSSAGQKVLNTFAYTGAFSVCAAVSGAQTTTLDLSQPYLDWAKENMQLNQLDPAEHYFCKGDTFHWLKRFARQGRKFNGIILDPPTFSRDDKGKVFRVEKDYGTLAELAAKCLEPGGWMLCSTNCRKLPLHHFTKMISQAVPRAQVTSEMMPPEYRGEEYLKSVWVEMP
ncbi:class I SAM-dependent rRNA methyltransferase [Persicirhabdus sediminis]|uniref:Class I SAM-dependent rRNA methyltransferase n=1 Tax=Persicirhabdus sediminis TaxID=454144 RepID=A0A8J7SJZ0_9BACT|nr:class I SAM-dependent methyltransferase [Persicirhabdus sediminis]MBK1791411.1 class I SAM-dependent rRNA methyltransferase [Persicirhabdus sediminis]